jgi:hypothetical protein
MQIFQSELLRRVMKALPRPQFNTHPFLTRTDPPITLHDLMCYLNPPPHYITALCHTLQGRSFSLAGKHYTECGCPSYDTAHRPRRPVVRFDILYAKEAARRSVIHGGLRPASLATLGIVGVGMRHGGVVSGRGDSAALCALHTC